MCGPGEQNLNPLCQGSVIRIPALKILTFHKQNVAPNDQNINQIYPRNIYRDRMEINSPTRENFRIALPHGDSS